MKYIINKVYDKLKFTIYKYRIYVISFASLCVCIRYLTSDREPYTSSIRCKSSHFDTYFKGIY